MNLCGHRTCRKAGVKARRPMAPPGAPVDPAGGAAPAMGVGQRDKARREAKLQRTPTWGAKCWITGFGKPLRFELWGAHEEHSLPDSHVQ